jgi:PadR family transcriptional regulator PadR
LAFWGTRIHTHFELQKNLNPKPGDQISIGAVHSTLDRLEGKGFLKSEMGKPTTERGGRRKRIFTMTALGKKVVKESRDFKVALWQQYPAFSGLSGIN